MPATKTGYETFYGVNGPAVILLGLGYGITDQVGVMLEHTNLFHEYELTVTWLALEQEETGMPLTLSLAGSSCLVTQKSEPDDDVFVSENFKFTFQSMLARRFGDSFSVLVAPIYATNTDHWEETSDSTFAIGVGGRWIVTGGFSLTGEWIPVVSGYSTGHDSWGLGLDWEVGGHAFQVVVTNSLGLTTDQFIPGGDLRFSDSEVRIGFSIFRTFWL